MEKRRAMEKKGRLEKVGLRVAVWREEGEGSEGCMHCMGMGREGQHASSHHVTLTSYIDLYEVPAGP